MGGGDISLERPRVRNNLQQINPFWVLGHGNVIFPLFLHGERGKGNLEIFHFSRGIREKGVTKIDTLVLILWDSCWRSWPAIDLEMLSVLWLGPYSAFNVSLPRYSFTHLVGFVASRVVFTARLRTRLMMFTASPESGWLVSERGGSPSGLGVGQGALPNCWVERHCLCPRGTCSYNWPIVSPQALRRE